MMRIKDNRSTLKYEGRRMAVNGAGRESLLGIRHLTKKQRRVGCMRRAAEKASG